MLSVCGFFPTVTLCKEGARFAQLTVFVTVLITKRVNVTVFWAL